MLNFFYWSIQINNSTYKLTFVMMIFGILSTQMSCTDESTTTKKDNIHHHSTPELVVFYENGQYGCKKSSDYLYSKCTVF